MLFPALAVDIVRVVAHAHQAVLAVAGEEEAVGAGPEQSLGVVTSSRVVVEVAVLFVSHGPGLGPAVAGPEGVLVAERLAVPQPGSGLGRGQIVWVGRGAQGVGDGLVVVVVEVRGVLPGRQKRPV